MILGLLKEPTSESRVAILPELVSDLTSNKIELLVEAGAGASAFASDDDYKNAGASIASRKDVIEKADLLVQINPPSDEELKKGKVWISVFNPLSETDRVKSLQSAGITTFSLDSIPRTTRAQAMDILSSMATVSGYRAVLEAALRLPTFFPMFMTAAGTIRPANVLVLGAGVAGLQAIASARRLGAQVQVFDVRSAVKEEVESLGGKFIEVEGATEDKAAGGYAVEQTEEYKKRQQEAINQQAERANVIICTARIPGREAPLLISKETVENMKAGSVIIDLAASTGGNCELTKDNEIIEHNGVTIVGESNYPSKMPIDASRMFGKNLFNFLKLLVDDEGKLHLNFEDEIVKQTCITYNGEIYNDRVKSLINS